MKKIGIAMLSFILMMNVGNSLSQQKKKSILFFGNSLTAGYGLDPELAFPNLIQQKIMVLH